MPYSLSVNGEPLLSATVRVPNFGAWWADVVFQDAPDIDGAVTLKIGDLELTGTLDPQQNASFASQRRARILAGAGGWGTLLPARHYHNDAGVQALTIASDAAREAGETLGAFAPEAAALGADYVRTSGPASRVLEDAIGSAAWWVGFDGQTRIGARAGSTPTARDYTVLDVEPSESLATLAVSDAASVSIGAVLTEGLDAPLTVRELEIVASAESLRVIVWGSDVEPRGRLASILRSIVARSTDDRVFGRIRYRVVSASGGRLALQVVKAGTGAPDLVSIATKPGIPGAASVPALSSIVLVEFIEGDPELPIVSGYAGEVEEGHEAQSLTFSAALTIKLGSDTAAEGVALGTSLKSWLDAHVHLHSDTGAPLFTSPPVVGTPASPIPDLSPAPSAKVFLE